MGDNCFLTQIIGKDGVLDFPRLDKFTKDVKLSNPYAVVSILGAQSSGKSTLLNHLFGTNFQEMNIEQRSQTTKGVWLAKARNIGPCTLVMDVEGTDGMERADRDDTAFENKSALFALAVSNVVIINMWCHDIGREQAGSRPLLKTIFQVLMKLKLFGPRKKTMLFALRDLTKTPFKSLVSTLRNDILKIWEGVLKPQAQRSTELNDFFDLQFVALPNYEEKEDSFNEQVSRLRGFFQQSIGHVGPSGNLPASDFSFSTQKIWMLIKEDEDLDLPTHKVMVATVRCDQISSDKVASFRANKEWQHCKEAVQIDCIPGFGKKISRLLHSCLSEYDMECIYYDEGVRTSKRQQLESEILQLVYPAYQSLMGHLLNGTLKAFKESFHKAQEKQEFQVAARDCTQSFLDKFNKGCDDATLEQVKWDPANFKNKLKHAIHAHVESVRALKAKVVDLYARYEGRLTRALAEPVKKILRSAPFNTWGAIKSLLVTERIAPAADLKYALLDLKVDEGTVKELLSRLENHGRSVVESQAKEESKTVLIRMKDRFTKLFNAYMSRVRKGKVDIQAIAEDALYQCMMMLWIISTIRLDGDSDNFENFRSLLLDENNQFDPLASISWKKEQILKAGTLISPEECKSLWSKFMDEVDSMVIPVLDAQEANKWKKRMFMISIVGLTVTVVKVAVCLTIFLTTGVPIFF